RRAYPTSASTSIVALSSAVRVTARRSAWLRRALTVCSVPLLIPKTLGHAGLPVCRSPSGERDRGTDRQQHGERREPVGERGDRGDPGDEQRAAGVAEFAAEFGGAHGLAEAFGRGARGQRGKAQRCDQPGARADEDGAGEYAGQA